MGWDEKFLGLAQYISTWSKDSSTKVGCVIAHIDDHNILSLGFNGLPRNVKPTPDRDEKPEKYHWYEHAERNAVNHAARHGVQLKGAAAYITGFPCSDCARGLINSGIVEVVVPPWEQDPFKDRKDWEESFQRSCTMLKEAGILIKYVSILGS